MQKTTFFDSADGIVAIVSNVSDLDLSKLEWLFTAKHIDAEEVRGNFIGSRSNVVSPWSSNVTAILSAAGYLGVQRCEIFRPNEGSFDAMLEQRYESLSQTTLLQKGIPEPQRIVEDIKQYNIEFGLALSEEEISFLEKASKDLSRKLTDTEVYGFGQINSEHCRHKIFNADFIIDGIKKGKSLFGLIKETTKQSGAHVVSAYKDNVAFIDGLPAQEFSPDASNVYGTKPQEYVISIKAETHNFPTTVEPFYGASTGSGGEIRDRMAGGQGGQVLSGLAVYMASSPRLLGHDFEKEIPERKWAYQTPQQILTKASNGASDFGNKFGQPLLCGSLVTAEVDTKAGLYAFDRCIMLAGGVGVTPKSQAQKKQADVGDLVVVLGGENFRIGMAGGSVSSVNSGQMSVDLETSAVQRANPEMQKRTYNVIRSLVERANNPIKLIHDHGAGGHINCLSELIEATGGTIDIDALPVGDSSLSIREILCNESQERMGLVIAPSDAPLLRSLCERERSPMYIVGTIGESQTICFRSAKETAFDLPANILFGASPKLSMPDSSTSLVEGQEQILIPTADRFAHYLSQVLSLEGVGSKDWLTNKVDRCVSGKVARQQCVGIHQLPLANCSITAVDYTSNTGIATALGSAPLASLVSAAAGARLAVAEALLNICFAPLEGGIERLALSANWMWPAKQPGENARLYEAVEALSKFCIELGVPVPTGKDSLSMTMQYPDGQKVRAPGTVIVTAVGPTKDFRKTVLPVLSGIDGTQLLLIDFSRQQGAELGGSALLQVINQTGNSAPDIVDAGAFKAGLNYLQQLVLQDKILSGHDVSYGGLITTLLEMSFASDIGLSVTCPSALSLFSEKPAVVIEVRNSDAANVSSSFAALGLSATQIAIPQANNSITVTTKDFVYEESVELLRRAWYAPSEKLETFQNKLASERATAFAKHPLGFSFPKGFSGQAKDYGLQLAQQKSAGPLAIVVREQGTNGERELSFALAAAGFRVKDVTMTDLISGREDLKSASFLGFPGGFSFSDCLGAGKGWAASFLCNSKAKAALQNFFSRPDTLSIGICNGCQVMAALELLSPDAPFEMHRNKSKKFESSFLAVEVVETKSVMLQPLVGSRLGIWVAHGEGQFHFPKQLAKYDLPVRYVSDQYPANPNGSPLNAAAICSVDGRHLAIMPHLERSSLPWHWGYYPDGQVQQHEISPWMLAFGAARKWVDEVSMNERV